METKVTLQITDDWSEVGYLLGSGKGQGLCEAYTASQRRSKR